MRTIEFWDTLPERKLELIDGRLVISTLDGSRRIAWALLQDHGPAIALPLATTDLWQQALQLAYQPHPMPQTTEAWYDWAQHVEHDSEPPPNHSQLWDEHYRLYQLFWMGLYHFCSMSGLGQSLGHDFVVRLGENALTPDQIFIANERLHDLHNYYLDGPPTVAVEITQEESAEKDHRQKRQIYEQAGVPEYWLIDPQHKQSRFHQLQPDGHYEVITVDHRGVCRAGDNGRYADESVDQHGVYHSPFVPGLALSVPHLWTMKDIDWAHERWLPFLPHEYRAEKRPRIEKKDGNELGWGALPFVPRIDLQPVPIRFEEFISWCPEAKFEGDGMGMTIGGYEGTSHVMGMLMMTFGLVDIVKFAHPRDWVAFLFPNQHRAIVEKSTAAIMQDANYELLDQIRDEIFFRGEVPALPNISIYADSMKQCEQELAEKVRNTILLKLARGEPLPNLSIS